MGRRYLYSRGPASKDNRFSKTHWYRNSVSGYHADFHLYQLEWTPGRITNKIDRSINILNKYFLDYIKISVDNVPLTTFNSPNGSFWDFGAFPSSQENPWRYGSKMAPFDQEVSSAIICWIAKHATVIFCYLLQPKFYLIINLAVGGTNGYFPWDAKNEGGRAQPWSATSTNVCNSSVYIKHLKLSSIKQLVIQALLDFWKGKSGWYPTWCNGNETSALQVDYVKVWAL